MNGAGTNRGGIPSHPLPFANHGADHDHHPAPPPSSRRRTFHRSRCRRRSIACRRVGPPTEGDEAVVTVVDEGDPNHQVLLGGPVAGGHGGRRQRRTTTSRCRWSGPGCRSNIDVAADERHRPRRSKCSTSAPTVTTPPARRSRRSTTPSPRGTGRRPTSTSWAWKETRSRDFTPLVDRPPPRRVQRGRRPGQPRARPGVDADVDRRAGRAHRRACRERLRHGRIRWDVSGHPGRRRSRVDRQRGRQPCGGVRPIDVAIHTRQPQGRRLHDRVRPSKATPSTTWRHKRSPRGQRSTGDMTLTGTMTGNACPAHSTSN